MVADKARALIARLAAACGTARLAAVAIALLTALYLILAGAVLNPRTFFNGDPGVKYLQAYNAALSHWSSLAVRNPAADIDPERRFSSLAANQFTHRDNAPDYGDYSELFILPVSVALALFGPRGMYLVTILAALGIMILTYRLSVRTAPRSAWIAPLLVGGCSPMMFYATELWEHTPAVLLSTAGVLLAVSASSRAEARRFFLAGLAIGAAIAIREELYAMLLAGLVALAWVDRRRRLPMAAAAAAGTTLALVPHWLLEWSHSGLPGRAGVARLLGFAVQAPPPEWALPEMSHWPLVEMLVPRSAAWAAVLAAALLLRLYLPRAARPVRRWLLLCVALASIAWAGTDAFSMLRNPARPDSVLRVFPAALLLLFLPPRTDSTSPQRREIAQLLTIAAVFTAVLCIVLPFSVSRLEPGGPEWGPRFLLPLYPLLATGIAFALERRGDWKGCFPAAPSAIAAAFAAVTLFSFVPQAVGIRELHQAKNGYERVVAATEAVDEGGVIVTTLWWFAAVTASVLYQHQVVSVDVAGNGPLPELLVRLEERGRSRLTFVTEGDHVSDAHAAALARAGWVETHRQVIPIWLRVGLVSFRRDPERSAR